MFKDIFVLETTFGEAINTTSFNDFVTEYLRALFSINSLGKVRSRERILQIYSTLPPDYTDISKLNINITISHYYH